MKDWQNSEQPRRNSKILGVRVDACSSAQALESIELWAKQGEAQTVCAANVHMVMEAYDDQDYKAILNSAGLVIPDGMPVVWMQRRLGFRNQQRVYGPDLMAQTLAMAEREGLAVGFYGGKQAVLAALLERARFHHQGLKISYFHSPPFREPTPEEEAEDWQEILKTGTQILFVALGCPRQERWISRHQGASGPVMLGVGAAFDFYAGAVAQAPRWMQKAGLEWFFRLLMEPGRLWRRYLATNPRFIWLSFLQLSGLQEYQ